MRRTFFTLLFIIVSLYTKCQLTDSAWFLNTYLSRFNTDTGTYLAGDVFVDEKGNKKTLADYKGTIIYLNVWATWCGNCMVKFPYQEQLSKRLKAINLDTSILFMNISIEDKKKDWKKAVKKYNPIGINLYSSDTGLLTKWNIEALPAYILLDTSGKVLGKNISGPDEGGTIDWILYCATKGISPVEAVLRNHTQGKLMEQHRSSSVLTDKEYAKWFQMTIQSFIEYQDWRQKQREKNHKF